MNRRQLFGWLSALPFVPAAPAREKEVYLYGNGPAGFTCVNGHPWCNVCVSPTPITFPAPTAEWGYARVNVSTTLATWAGGPSYIDMKYRPKLPEWF
jgi:hypothetical protein